MISAVEALGLPSARLSPLETAAADGLEADIEAHIRLKMERRGCDFQTTELRSNVIAEVNQRLKAKGWEAQWRQLFEQSLFEKIQNRLAGFALSLAPSDSAYRAAAVAAEPQYS